MKITRTALLLLLALFAASASGQSLGEVIEHLHPTANQLAGDFRVEDRGDGPRIAKWNEAKLGAQPTQTQIDQARIEITAAKQAAATKDNQDRAILVSAIDKLKLGQNLTQAELNAVLIRIIQKLK